MSLLAALLALLAVLCLFLGIHRLLRPQSEEIEERLLRYGARRTPDWEQTPAQSRRGEGSAVARHFDKALEGRSFAQELQAEISRANLKLTVSEFLGLQAIAIMATGLLAFVISRQFFTVIPFGLLGFFLPKMWLARRQAARLKALNSQLADTITLLSNSLRAGMSLVQAMEMVAREGSPPISEEFARVTREIGLGLSPNDALRSLVRRVKSDDVDLLVTAIIIQHEVGGNLTRILDTIATTIRERVKIKGEIKSLTSQQRIAGIVLAALPVVLGGVLMLISPGYMGKLFTPGPWLALPGIAAAMVTIGFVVINRIVDIEV